MNFYSFQFIVPCYLIIGLLYLSLAWNFIDSITMKTVGVHVQPLQAIFLVVIWPISAVVLGCVVVGWATRNWKTLKHSILGYWPVMAHASNLIDHWEHSSKEINEVILMLRDLKAYPDFESAVQHVDLHMCELKHCLATRYGMKLKDPYIVPPGGVTEIPPCPIINPEDKGENRK